METFPSSEARVWGLVWVVTDWAPLGGKREGGVRQLVGVGGWHSGRFEGPAMALCDAVFRGPARASHWVSEEGLVRPRSAVLQGPSPGCG